MLLRKRFLSLAAVAGLAFAGVACSDDGATDDTGADTGTEDLGGDTGTEDLGGETGTEEDLGDTGTEGEDPLGEEESGDMTEDTEGDS